MAHKPAYHLRPLTRFDPTFQEKAADLFGRVKSRIGEGALTRTGSYSFRELPQRFASTPRTFAKIIIREDAVGDGVYVLLRADGLLDPWLKHDPWTRIDPDLTLRIVSVSFYHFQLSDSDDLDGIADAITAGSTHAASVQLSGLAVLCRLPAFYPVPVRRDRDSPPASFRSRPTTGTLAPGLSQCDAASVR